MFGGTIHTFELQNDTQWNVSELNGFKDTHDGRVYDWATKHFRIALDLYEVSQMGARGCHYA
eukprot:5014708-Amphidinium_carterae.1